MRKVIVWRHDTHVTTDSRHSLFVGMLQFECDVIVIRLQRIRSSRCTCAFLRLVKTTAWLWLPLLFLRLHGRDILQQCLHYNTTYPKTNISKNNNKTVFLSRYASSASRSVVALFSCCSAYHYYRLPGSINTLAPPSRWSRTLDLRGGTQPCDCLLATPIVRMLLPTTTLHVTSGHVYLEAM